MLDFCLIIAFDLEELRHQMHRLVRVSPEGAHTVCIIMCSQVYWSSTLSVSTAVPDLLAVQPLLIETAASTRTFFAVFVLGKPVM